MSAYYVDSFAYDFDLFAPQTKQAENVIEIDRKTKSTTRTSHRPRRVLGRPMAITLILILLLGLIAGNIFLRVKVTEVTSRIDACDEKLERAISENTSLERYQIRYIDVLDGDKTEVLQNGTLVTAAAEE